MIGLLIILMFPLMVFIMVWQKIKPIRQAKKKYGRKEVISAYKFKYASGLNLPENIECTVVLLKSRIIISASGQEFNLSREKIFDVSVKTIEEIRTEYSSDMNSMALGYVLAGTVGAIVGGMPSERRVKSQTKYLIISYFSGETIKYILFDVTKDDIVDGSIGFLTKYERSEKKLKKLTPKENVRIEL